MEKKVEHLLLLTRQQDAAHHLTSHSFIRSASASLFCLSDGASIPALKPKTRLCTDVKSLRHLSPSRAAGTTSNVTQRSRAPNSPSMSLQRKRVFAKPCLSVNPSRSRRSQKPSLPRINSSSGEVEATGSEGECHYVDSKRRCFGLLTHLSYTHLARAEHARRFVSFVQPRHRRRRFPRRPPIVSVVARRSSAATPGRSH